MINRIGVLIVCLTASLVLFSCQSRNTEAAGNDASEGSEASHSRARKTCYEDTKGGNHFWLTLEVANAKATGTLAYQIGDAVKKEGTLKGEMHGDTLWADYTLELDGKTTVREVLFIIYANLAKEGYGPMKNKEGKVVFENKRNVDFNGGIDILRVECQ